MSVTVFFNPKLSLIGSVLWLLIAVWFLIPSEPPLQVSTIYDVEVDFLAEKDVLETIQPFRNSEVGSLNREIVLSTPRGIQRISGYENHNTLCDSFAIGDDDRVAKIVNRELRLSNNVENTSEDIIIELPVSDMRVSKGISNGSWLVFGVMSGSSYVFKVVQKSKALIWLHTNVFDSDNYMKIEKLVELDGRIIDVKPYSSDVLIVLTSNAIFKVDTSSSTTEVLFKEEYDHHVGSLVSIAINKKGWIFFSTRSSVYELENGIATLIAHGLGGRLLFQERDFRDGLVVFDQGRKVVARLTGNI